MISVVTFKKQKEFNWNHEVESWQKSGGYSEKILLKKILLLIFNYQN